METNVLAPVPHRQYVFTVPRLLRPIFSHRRRLLGVLCQIIERLLREAYTAARPGGRPMILFVQTFGDLVTFNPHVHVLAADGVFREDGVFFRLPPVPCGLLERRYRSEVLALLMREREVGEALVQRIGAWRHTGFSVHNGVRVRDVAGRKNLAQYMLRAPFSLDKMRYDARAGTVIYRSHMHKTLKRNFQVMSGVQWLELLCSHIPDRFEHLVRYAGWYSTRCRGKRARSVSVPAEADSAPPDEIADAIRARSAWARLIHKVYEVDPLECPRCKGPMQVIAVIDQSEVVRRILEHLHLWSPDEPSGPVRDPPVFAHESVDGEPEPTFTYHPVPDIA